MYDIVELRLGIYLVLLGPYNRMLQQLKTGARCCMKADSTTFC